MSAQLESSEAAILSRVIQPDSGDWSPAAAEAILRIGFNETDRERMTTLLGTLPAYWQATGINEIAGSAFAANLSCVRWRV
jgi:hypothetical protein